ncbi:hypothetical protein L1987_23324 [Smallanthus sonchifolius]|uniref:Uncharacterized protein n=1 Tax=Smallanthus sonchifolius TaxID=185202 RepID=A0ACB9IH52_9ASTR|nr:hypothetical protein L1987_23324 [Smallanthus sonchifolius]
MMSSPSLPTTLESKEDAEHNKICQDYNHMIKTLPKGNGWRVQHLYNYNGFWLDSSTLKTNMLLNTYFKPQPTDIFLASFMKTGTTWFKALMFSTINRHNYTFSNHYLHHHGPQSTFLKIDCEDYPVHDFTHLPARRLFATHYARTLLPPCMTSCRFVYVCRDRKDVLISKWIYLSKLRSKDLAPLSLDEAFELFCNGVSEYGPYWDHVLSYWRDSLVCPDKILFVRYEDMKKQPLVKLRKLAAFMGKGFTLEEVEKGVVEEIERLCSFENLSGLEVNRKGVEKFGKLVEVERQGKSSLEKERLVIGETI